MSSYAYDPTPSPINKGLLALLVAIVATHVPVRKTPDLCQPTQQSAPTVLENPMLPMPPIMETLIPPSLGLALMLTFPPVMETEALCLLNIPPLVAELEKLIMLVVGEDLAKTCPIEIPSSAVTKEQEKQGYDQVQYRWSDGTYKYEARWHTRTPGAPPEQGNTWVVERKLPGEGARQPKTEILTGNNEWTPKWKWQEAIEARKNGTATAEQDALLKGGHWPAP